MEYSPKGCWAPQRLAKGHGAVEAFPSHETQRLAPGSAKSRNRETHGTGGRTSGVVGMLGPWCGLKSGAPLARATNPKTGGRLTQTPAGHQPHNWAGRRFFSKCRVGGLWVDFHGDVSCGTLRGPSTVSRPRSVREALPTWCPTSYCVLLSPCLPLYGSRRCCSVLFLSCPMSHSGVSAGNCFFIGNHVAVALSPSILRVSRKKVFLVPSVAEEHRVALRSIRLQANIVEEDESFSGSVHVRARILWTQSFNGYEYKLCPVCIGQGIVDRRYAGTLDFGRDCRGEVFGRVQQRTVEPFLWVQLQVSRDLRYSSSSL